MASIDRLISVIRREVEECIELFDKLDSIKPSTFPLISSISHIESNDNSSGEISYEEAVKQINQKIERCIKLFNALDSLRFRIRRYRDTKFNIDSILNEIVNVLYGYGRKMIFEYQKYITEKRSEKKEGDEVTEVRIDDKVLSEINRKFMSGEYYE